MANVLGELFGDIAKAIRNKTGETNTMKPNEFPQKINGIIVGQGDTILLEEQELSFGFNSNYNVYSTYINPAPFTLVIGETYHVKWGEDEFTCVAMDGSAVAENTVLIGNGSAFELAGNGEPFLIVCDPSFAVDFISLTDTEPTTRMVKVWQESTKRTFKYTQGYFNSAEGGINTIEHKMGRVPDIIVVYVQEIPQNSWLVISVGYSQAMMNSFEGDAIAPTSFIVYDANLVTNITHGMETTSEWAEKSGAVRNVDSSTFTVGGNVEYGFMPMGSRWNWFAISGIV